MIQIKGAGGHAAIHSWRTKSFELRNSAVAKNFMLEAVVHWRGTALTTTILEKWVSIFSDFVDNSRTRLYNEVVEMVDVAEKIKEIRDNLRQVPKVIALES